MGEPHDLGTTRAGLLAAVTAGATLQAQVLLHRLVSAKLLSNYAFLVISLTMLGFAVSGVILTAVEGRVRRHAPEALAAAAALLALSLLAVASLFCHAELATNLGSRLDLLRDLSRFVPHALALAIPFAFGGLILGALLSSPGLPAGRIYAFDLGGSAVGALAAVPVIQHLGVERGLVAVAGVTAVAAAVLCRPRGAAVRLALALALAGAGLAGAFTAHAFPQVPEQSVPFCEYLRWDPVARIEMWRIPPPTAGNVAYPSLVGGHPGLHARMTRMITQNNYAYTIALDYDGRRESLAGVDETLYAAAYEARVTPRPRVAVVGVGGGFDVLTALRYDAAQVVGIEVNAAVLELLRNDRASLFRAWVGDPRVALVEGDGRRVLATTAERFDVLQLSGVDSYSGTPAAAHVFSENYLYTLQAFELYLARLTEQGILNLMRLEFDPPREVLKATVTAVSALRRRGVAHPARHVVVLAATRPRPNFAALLVKRTPFAADEIARITAWAGRSPYFAVAAAPALNGSRANNFQRFLGLDDPRLEAAFVDGAPFDIAPPTDDRPFFFRHSFWSHVLGGDQAVRRSVPAMELSLLVLLAVVGAFAWLTVQLPLGLLLRRGVRARDAWRYAVYFAALGLGYMWVEISLLQRLGLFLGHPNHALSVVLAGLLGATGVGSWLAERFSIGPGGLGGAGYATALLIVVLEGFALPRLSALLGLAFWQRAVLSVALMAPLGLLLGTFLPAGLRALKSRDPAQAPWAWGVNGTFSVLGPIVGIAIAMTWGGSALLLAAAPLYLVAARILPAGDGSPGPLTP